MANKKSYGKQKWTYILMLTLLITSQATLNKIA